MTKDIAWLANEGGLLKNDYFVTQGGLLDTLAEDLAKVIEAFGGVADLLGHSMGGKAAMRLALNGRRSKLPRRLRSSASAPS